MLTRGEEYVAREVADFEAERRERQVRRACPSSVKAKRFDNLTLVEIGPPMSPKSMACTMFDTGDRRGRACPVPSQGRARL